MAGEMHDGVAGTAAGGGDSPQFEAAFQKDMLRYEQWTHELERLLKSLLRSRLNLTEPSVLVHGRAKTMKSLLAKATRPEKSYTDPVAEITDRAGIRVVVRTLNDVDRVASLLREEFEVDEANSVSKGADLEPNRFDYTAEHYIIRLKEPRSSLTEWQQLAGLWAEVQVRTYLQDAWASVSRTFLYQAEDVPKPLQRRLFALVALLEIADREFDSFIREEGERLAAKEREIEDTKGAVPLDAETLLAFMHQSPAYLYWLNHVDQVANPVDPPNPRLLNHVLAAARYVGISTVSQLEELLIALRGWGEEFLLEAVRNYLGRRSFNAEDPFNVQIDMSAPLMYLLVGHYPEKFQPETMRRDYSIGNGRWLLKAARVANPRFRDDL